MNRFLKTIANNIPFIKNLHVPPGHFYSPVISTNAIRDNQEEIWPANPQIPAGIDLNSAYQFELLQELVKYYYDIPFKSTPQTHLRYYYKNNMFLYSDAIFLYCMIRHFRPQNIIEVGSGFTSAIMLDTNNLHFKNEINCTFIEPYADRLRSILKEEDDIRLIEKPVQKTDLSQFEKLNKNDILFIDSTHVSKTGSDVNFILFEILPRLKKGVIIHFHDIFYPFEYPKSWVLEQKRSWNEAYILRAYLTNNSNVSILAFNTYLTTIHKQWFEDNMPLCLKNTGGSIWLQIMN